MLINIVGTLIASLCASVAITGIGYIGHSIVDLSFNHGEYSHIYRGVAVISFVWAFIHMWDE